MALDLNDLRKQLEESEKRLETHITREVARLEGQLIAHLADRYPHQPARETYTAQITDWEKWRAGVDGWRRFIAGGFAVVGIEFAGVGVLLLTHIIK